MLILIIIIWEWTEVHQRLFSWRIFGSYSLRTSIDVWRREVWHFVIFGVIKKWWILLILFLWWICIFWSNLLIIIIIILNSTVLNVWRIILILILMIRNSVCMSLYLIGIYWRDMMCRFWLVLVICYCVESWCLIWLFVFILFWINRIIWLRYYSRLLISWFRFSYFGGSVSEWKAWLIRRLKLGGNIYMRDSFDLLCFMRWLYSTLSFISVLMKLIIGQIIPIELLIIILWLELYMLWARRCILIIKLLIWNKWLMLRHLIS